MNPAVAYFRQLSVTDRLAGLRKVMDLVKAHAGEDADLKEFASGLLGHLASCTQNVFTYLEEERKNIESLPQSHQGKKSLLLNLEDYAFVDAATRERIKDRITKGLVQKPPEPEAKKAKASVMASGINHEFDEGFEP